MFESVFMFAMNGEFNEACFDDYSIMSMDDIILFTSVCYAI